MSLARLWTVAWKELLQLKRDGFTLTIMAILPVMNLLLFGWAINTDVRHIPTIVYDQDRSPASRDLARSMQATGFYDVVAHARSYQEVKRALQSGEARVALVVPAEYGAGLGQSGTTTRVQLVVDATDPQTVASAMNTATSLIQSRSVELQAGRLGAAGAVQPLELEPVTWYNPDLRTSVFIVPGLIGAILTMTMVMLTAMAIARERERGTLEQLIVSPVGRVELIVGKIIPYVAIGIVQMSLVLGVGRVAFDVPLEGSLPLLYALALLFIAANLAIGLFLSTLAHTQQQAMQLSFFFFLPNLLLSGFMFPFEGMPKAAQWLAELLPLTHFLRIVRGITLKGCHFADLSQELPWLLGIFLTLVVLASLRFSKKLA